MAIKRIFDGCCGAGGAAEGLHRAFPEAEITGYDLQPQPHYPFRFVQGDALAASLDGYDMAWFSPPCQGYSQTNNIWKREYPKLIEPVREKLQAWGGIYVIENVVGAPLHYSIKLCGAMFGLRVYRHRLFESNVMLFQTCHPRHDARASYGGRAVGDMFHTLSGHFTDAKAGAAAIGIDWMNRNELAQAIPPAYSEFIGRQLATVH